MRFPKLKKKWIRRTPTDQQKILFVKHFLAGGIAGIISRTATAPFDRLKIFYQVSTKNQHMGTVLREMIREGGIRSLWRGNLMNVVKTCPKTAIRFACYDSVKSSLRLGAKSTKELNSLEKFYAGAMAGLIAQACCMPLEVLKVRLSLRRTGQYRGTFDAIQKIYKAEGVRAFFRGFWPTLFAIIPYSGLELAGYEKIRNFASEKKGKRLNNVELFFLSSISGMLSQTASYPLSIVVTRAQANTASKKETKSGFRIWMDIWKYEGVKGYYRGLVPNLLKFMPAVAITFISYEQVIYWAGVAMN